LLRDLHRSHGADTAAIKLHSGEKTMADTSKLRLIAELARETNNANMAAFRTCALGQAVQAGILIDEHQFCNVSDTGAYFGFASVTPLRAAKQLGITCEQAETIFIDLAEHGESDPRNNAELPCGFERGNEVAAALIALAADYDGEAK
jgi:hypothetical protein